MATLKSADWKKNNVANKLTEHLKECVRQHPLAQDENIGDWIARTGSSTLAKYDVRTISAKVRQLKNKRKCEFSARHLLSTYSTNFSKWRASFFLFFFLFFLFSLLGRRAPRRSERCARRTRHRRQLLCGANVAQNRLLETGEVLGALFEHLLHIAA